MGKITIIAHDIFENASGSIQNDASHIVNQSGGKIIQIADKELTYNKNQDRKPPTDIRINKVEGPFDDNGKLVDKIELGKSYAFKATPTRKPSVIEIALLKWALKLDDDKKEIIGGVASLNKLEGDKITIAFKINHDFEKARIYAFYQKPTDEESVALQLKENLCFKKPPKYPTDYGSCNYYKWRFENFLERHKDCSHLPPKYYYGPMKINSNIPYVGEDIDKANDWWSGVINTDPLKPPYPKYAKGTPIVRESYGYKYCVAFSNDLMPRLSKNGQEWLKQARKYLQEYMDKGLTTGTYKSKYNESFNKKVQVKTLKDVELDENWFQEFAFATHPDAYLDAGLLKISMMDKMEVTRTPDFKEWASIATWEQAMYVAKEQLLKWKNDSSQYGKEKYQEAQEYLEKVQNEIENEEQALKQKAEKLLKEIESWF